MDLRVLSPIDGSPRGPFPSANTAVATAVGENNGGGMVERTAARAQLRLAKEAPSVMAILATSSCAGSGAASAAAAGNASNMSSSRSSSSAALFIVGNPANGHNAKLVAMVPSNNNKGANSSSSSQKKNSVHVLVSDLDRFVEGHLSNNKSTVKVAAAPTKKESGTSGTNNSNGIADPFRLCIGGVEVPPTTTTMTSASSSSPRTGATTLSDSGGSSSPLTAKNSYSNAAAAALRRRRCVAWTIATTITSASSSAATSSSSSSAVVAFIIRYVAGEESCTVMGLEVVDAASSDDGEEEGVQMKVISCEACPLACVVTATPEQQQKAAAAAGPTSPAPAMASPTPAVASKYLTSASAAAAPAAPTASTTLTTFKITDIASVDNKFTIAAAVSEDVGENGGGASDDDDDGDRIMNSGGSSNSNNKKKFIVALSIGTTRIVSESVAKAVSAAQAASNTLAALGLGKKDSGDNNNGGGEVIGFGSRKQRERAQAEAAAASKASRNDTVECYELALVTGVCVVKASSSALSSSSATTSLAVCSAPTAVERLVVPVQSLTACPSATTNGTMACGSGGGGGGPLFSSSTSAKANAIAAGQCVQNACGAASSSASSAHHPNIAPHPPQWRVSCTTPMNVGASATLWSFDVLVGVADLPTATGGANTDEQSNGAAPTGHQQISLVSKGIAAPGTIGRVAVVYNRQTHINMKKALLQQQNGNKDSSLNNLTDSANTTTIISAVDPVEKVPHTCSYGQLSYMQEQNAPHYYGGAFAAPTSTLDGNNSNSNSGGSGAAQSFFATPISTSSAIGSAATTMGADMMNYVALYGEDIATGNIARRRRREERLAKTTEENNGNNSGAAAAFSAANGKRIVFNPDRLIAAEPLKAIMNISLSRYTLGGGGTAATTTVGGYSGPSAPPPSLLLLVLPSCLVLVDPRFSTGRCVIATLRCPLPTINGAFSGEGWARSLGERDGAKVLLDLNGGGGGGGVGATALGGGGGGINGGGGATGATSVSSRVMTAWEKQQRSSAAITAAAMGGDAASVGLVSSNFTSGSATRAAAAAASAAAAANSIQTNTTVVVGTIMANDASTSPAARMVVNDGGSATLISFIIAVDPSSEMPGAVAVNRFEVTSIDHGGFVEEKKKDGHAKIAPHSVNTNNNSSTNTGNKKPLKTIMTCVTHAPTTTSLARALDGAGIGGTASTTSTTSSIKLNRAAEPTTALIAMATTDGLVRLSDLTNIATKKMSDANNTAVSGTNGDDGLIVGVFSELLGTHEKLTQLFVAVESSSFAAPLGYTTTPAGRVPVAAKIVCCLGFSSGLVKIFETKLTAPQDSIIASSSSTSSHKPAPSLRYERYLHNAPVTHFFNADQIEKHWHLASLHNSSNNKDNSNGNGGLTSPAPSTLMSPTTAASPTSKLMNTGTAYGASAPSSPTANSTATPSHLASMDFQIVSVSATAGTVCLHRKEDYHRYGLLHGSFSSSVSAAVDPITGVFFDAESEYTLITTLSGKGYLWQFITGTLERIYRTPADYINTIDVAANLLLATTSSKSAAGSSISSSSSDGFVSSSSCGESDGADDDEEEDICADIDGTLSISSAIRNASDAALSLLPISAHIDPVSRRSVLSLSAVRFAAMLVRELGNCCGTTVVSGADGGGEGTGFSPTVISGVFTLLSCLSALYARAFLSTYTVSAAETAFKTDVAALASVFGFGGFEDISDRQQRNHQKDDGGASSSTSSSLTMKVLFAVSVLKAMANVSPASANSSASAIAGRLLLTITSGGLPWAVPTANPASANDDQQHNNAACYLAQSRRVVDILREMVPLLIAANATPTATQPSSAAKSSSSLFLSEGASIVVASALSHISQGPQCLGCKRNLLKNPNAVGGGDLFEVFSASLVDPTICKAPIVYTPTAAAASSSSSVVVTTTAPSSSSSGGGGAAGVNLSAPAPIITTSSAGGGSAAGASSSMSSITPTALDQSAYLFLLSAIVGSGLTPKNDKQRMLIAEAARDLESKLPLYLKLAVVGTTPNAAAAAGGNGNAPSSASTSGNIGVLCTVLKLVSTHWLCLRPHLKSPEALLKSILVFGALRDVTSATIRSASLNALSMCFIQQILANNTAVGGTTTQLWEMLKNWFNTAASAFHPDFVWRGGGNASSDASFGNNLNTTFSGSSTVAAAAAAANAAASNINSKDATDTHRYMLIHCFSRMIAMNPAAILAGDGMLRMLPLSWIAIDPHSPSRAERESCFSAVAALFRATVKYLPHVSFQQKFQRIAVGHNNGNITVFDVKSTDEIVKFMAFEPKGGKGRANSKTPTAAYSASVSSSSAAAAAGATATMTVPANGIAAVAYSNLHHDIAVLSFDLSCLRIYHASGASTFFLPSNYNSFKLRREVPLPPNPMLSASSSSSASASLSSAASALPTPQQVVERCSLVWLSPQCVEVSSPWHDKVQATI